MCVCVYRTIYVKCELDKEVGKLLGQICMWTPPGQITGNMLSTVDWLTSVDNMEGTRLPAASFNPTLFLSMKSLLLHFSPSLNLLCFSSATRSALSLSVLHLEQ